mgnify:CR=1 FL=1
MNSDYQFIEDFEQLRCCKLHDTKLSKMKMSHKNIRNEPVWLKIIRLGTQVLCYLQTIREPFLSLMYVGVSLMYVYP